MLGFALKKNKWKKSDWKRLPTGTGSFATPKKWPCCSCIIINELTSSKASKAMRYTRHLFALFNSKVPRQLVQQQLWRWIDDNENEHLCISSTKHATQLQTAMSHFCRQCWTPRRLLSEWQNVRLSLTQNSFRLQTAVPPRFRTLKRNEIHKCCVVVLRDGHFMVTGHR